MKTSSGGALLSWGAAPRPAPDVDTFARAELREHVSVLCSTLHGPQPAACSRCADLLRPAS